MVVADLHVHSWPGYDPGRLLRTALEEFGRRAPQAREAVLGFTLTKGERLDAIDGFLEESEDWSKVGGYRSRWMRQRDGYLLDLLPGRQVVTFEGLEVHGFFPSPDETVPQSGSTEDLCKAWLDQGALVVLPFGVGKWRGRRREVVQRIVDQRPEVALGDNGNRLRGLGFRRLVDNLGYGGALFSGSDPLPLPGAEVRVGSTGFLLEETSLDKRSSLEMLRLVLSEDPQRVRTFGEGTGLVRFLYSQFRMQWRKRLGR